MLHFYVLLSKQSLKTGPVCPLCILHIILKLGLQNNEVYMLAQGSERRNQNLKTPLDGKAQTIMAAFTFYPAAQSSS